MDIQWFSGFGQLIGGLFVGTAFGFLLRKAHVTRFDVIVKQLMLKDFTVMKVMLSAIAFGSLGISLLSVFTPGLPSAITTTTFGAAMVGGAIFGVGMAVMGFCPGTAIAAIADGSKDIWFGVLGMTAGALLYAEIEPFFATSIKCANQMTQVTLDQATGWPSLFFPVLFLAAVAALKWLDRKSSKQSEIAA